MECRVQARNIEEEVVWLNDRGYTVTSAKKLGDDFILQCHKYMKIVEIPITKREFKPVKKRKSFWRRFSLMKTVPT